MPQKYYQKYGPISRRRSTGDLHDELDPPPPTPAIAVGRPRPERAPSLRLPLASLVVIAALAICGYLGWPYLAPLVAADQVPRGVTLQGVAVGGMRADQVRSLAAARYGEFSRRPVTITYQGRSWNPSLAELGVTFTASAVGDDILAVGRRGDLRTSTAELWQLWRGGGVDLSPHLSVDRTQLQRYLTGIAAEVERPPTDAALSLAAGNVLPTPASPGRQLLVDDTASEVLRVIQTLQPQQVPLRTRVLPPRLGDAAIVGAVDSAKRMLAQPLVLRQGERSWTWDADRLVEMIAVQPISGTMRAGPDPLRLAHAVENLAQTADSPSAEPRVAFRSGKLRIVAEGTIGLRIRQTDAVAAIAAALSGGTRTVELPIEQVSPKITAASLSSLGVNELVAEGKSSFTGSAEYRITNIRAGAARMDGVLIPPGAEFSFNTQLGAVDETNGFVKGYAVIGNRTQLEWGGGVCQVSTTVFRTAFWAGLPITERHAHPFYIKWYDEFSFPVAAAPGMDATIYTGVLDLKFKNDTGHWMLMESETDVTNGVLAVRLYGTRPNRTVEAVGPDIGREIAPPVQAVYVDDRTLPSGTLKQTDHARKGMDINVYRVITQDGVRQPPELFFTRFKAWPDVFVRGTG